jgi:hypothetical protein
MLSAELLEQAERYELRRLRVTFRTLAHLTLVGPSLS